MNIRLIAAAVLLSARCAIAATGPTPEATARLYFDALRDQGMAAGVAYMHPHALGSLKRAMTPLFEADAAQGGEKLIKPMLGAQATLQTFRDLPAADFARKYFTVIETATRKADLKIVSVEILGKVTEGESAHVVARMHMKLRGNPVTRMQVVTCLPHDKGYAIGLTGDMENLFNQIGSRAGK